MINTLNTYWKLLFSPKEGIEQAADADVKFLVLLNVLMISALGYLVSSHHQVLSFAKTLGIYFPTFVLSILTVAIFLTLVCKLFKGHSNLKNTLIITAFYQVLFFLEYLCLFVVNNIFGQSYSALSLSAILEPTSALVAFVMNLFSPFSIIAYLYIYLYFRHEGKLSTAHSLSGTILLSLLLSCINYFL